MKQFVVTTHDNEKYITSKYRGIDDLHSGAWMNEGVVVCDEAIISIHNIKLITPSQEEVK